MPSPMATWPTALEGLSGTALHPLNWVPFPAFRPWPHMFSWPFVPCLFLLLENCYSCFEGQCAVTPSHAEGLVTPALGWQKPSIRNPGHRDLCHLFQSSASGCCAVPIGKMQKMGRREGN